MTKDSGSENIKLGAGPGKLYNEEESLSSPCLSLTVLPAPVAPGISFSFLVDGIYGGYICSPGDLPEYVVARSAWVCDTGGGFRVIAPLAASELMLGSGSGLTSGTILASCSVEIFSSVIC